VSYALNPHYSGDKLDLEVVTLDQPDLSYEYNTLIFVRPKGTKGQVYWAQDSGCSCPTPFEQYEGTTQAEVLEKMSRVRGPYDALIIFNGWRSRYNGPFLPEEAFPEKTLREWF
jgi:hypothetical protein